MTAGGVTFWYLASPYSLYPGGLEAAFVAACRNAALLIRAGVPVYSPIAHMHPVAVQGGIDPLDHDIWLPADAPMMAAASGLIVLELETWRDSRGIRFEIDDFGAASKPIVQMSPGVVPAAVLAGAA